MSKATSSALFTGSFAILGVLFLSALVGGLVAAIGRGARDQIAVLSLTTAVIVGVAVWAIWDSRSKARARREAKAARQKALDDYVAAARALIANPKPSEIDARRAQQLGRGVPAEESKEEFNTAYRDAVADAIADQLITPGEQSRLSLLARGLGLAPETVKQANRAGFLEGVWALIKDGNLTEAEDAKFESLRAAFRVEPADLQLALSKVDQLRQARAIDEAPSLFPIESPLGIKLKKGEVCYFSTRVTEKKLKVARAYVEDGERHTEKELGAHREGELFVTNERLFLLADGTTSIKLDALLRVAVEPMPGAEAEAVALTVDGRKTPYYFDAPEPFVLVAHLFRVLRDHRAKEGEGA